MKTNDWKVPVQSLIDHIKTAVDVDPWAKEMAEELLKEQEAVEPYMDYDGHDVWRCGNCGATIFHIEHSHADEDWKSYAKFCRQCGRPVKWE